MFDRVIDWLENGGPDGHYSDRDVRTAVAALFYHMVSVDGQVSPKETDALIAALASQFDLSHDQVHELMHRGERQDRDAGALFPFTAIINHELSEAQRIDVIDCLRDLADADGIRHPLENDLLQHLKQLLKVA